MKLAKLSLAAMVVAGLASSSFAASTTLEDAFKNGKVSGELKAWYFSKDDAHAVGGSDTEMINTGVTLGYITDSLYGFRLGTTFQSSYTPLATEGEKADYQDHQAASGAVLSEAYLGYAIGKTDVKIGRQYISTPLVNGSGSRFFKESFEGVTVVNTDLPQTTLIAGYVQKFQGRTSHIASSTVGDAPNFEKVAAFTGGVSSAYFDDAYTVAVINKSITNTTLTAQYALVNDVTAMSNYTPVSTINGDADVYYTEVNYELPMNGFKLGFDVNFRGSHLDGTTAFENLYLDGTYTAGRISIKDLAGFGASFAAGTTSGSDSVIAGMGNGPTSYTSTLINGTSKRMTANTDSYLFAATYDFSKIGVAGLTALAQYGFTNQDAFTQGNVAQKYADITNFAAGVTYAVPYLKGLTTSLEYENARTESYLATGTKEYDRTADELWFKAGYKF